MIHYEMDDGPRRTKGPPIIGKKPSGKGERRGTPEMHIERRPLKTVSLNPPDYQVDLNILINSYLEKEIKFAGIVPHIPIHLDITNRTEVLRAIDKGKREKRLATRLTYDHDAIFSLSVHNIRICKRDGYEEQLLRVPIHEIAAICYVTDDADHIVTIKYGNSQETSDMCELAVAYCDKRSACEELCSLINQCFQQVYTDSTIQFLDAKLNQAAHGMSISSSTIRSNYSNSSTPKRGKFDNKISFLSQSQLDLEETATLCGSSASRSNVRLLETVRKDSLPRSEYQESELNPTQKEFISDYMKKLHTKLNADELKKFAELLNARGNISFSDFCDKVLTLFGPSRKYLIADMKPFVSEDEYPIFEAFLRRVGLDSSWTTVSPTDLTASRYRRTLSDASTFSNPVDEYDRILNGISQDIDAMGTSVDMNTNPDAFLPKTT